MPFPDSSPAEPAPIPFPQAAAPDAVSYEDFLGGACGGKDEAARYLGVKASALDDWMRPVGKPRGRGLPHFKIGHTVRFRRASIEAWLAGQERNRAQAAA